MTSAEKARLNEKARSLVDIVNTLESVVSKMKRIDFDVKLGDLSLIQKVRAVEYEVNKKITDITKQIND